MQTIAQPCRHHSHSCVSTAPPTPLPHPLPSGCRTTLPPFPRQHHNQTPLTPHQWMDYAPSQSTPQVMQSAPYGDALTEGMGPPYVPMSGSGHHITIESAYALQSIAG